MSELAARGDFVTKRALGTNREFIFCGLAIDEEARAGRDAGGGLGAEAVAFFTDDEEQSKIADAGIEERFRGCNHRGDYSLGIAGATAPEAIGVFAGRKKRRNGVEMSGERNGRLAERNENIFAIRRDGEAFEFSGVAGRERQQSCHEKIGHEFFFSRGRFDIHQRAREGEEFHFFFLVGLGQIERTKPADAARVVGLSIALHPFSEDDSEQALGLLPNQCAHRWRKDFGGKLLLAPFTGRPKAIWGNASGHSWPPHLYQALPR